MSGQAIGKKLALGFVGSVSRASDTVIASYPAKGVDIRFGDPVALNGDGTVSKVGAATTPDKVIGFAVRGVQQAKSDTSDGFFYREGEAVDVLLRGSMVVACNAGNPAALGAVHVRIVAGTGLSVGDVVASAVEDATIELPDVVFASNEKDADGAVEITVLRRHI